VYHARNPEFVLGMVLSGRGVAFDPGMVARKEPRVVWRPLPDAGLAWRLSLAWPAAAPHPMARGLAEQIVRAVQGDGVSALAPAQDEPQLPWDIVFGRS
jgi:DNA-binding transcriptional LysR family regulator